MPGSTVLAQRNPTLLFRFSGEFLLRLGARAFDGLLWFHDAPRKERFPKAPWPRLGIVLIERIPAEAAVNLSCPHCACPAPQHLSDLQTLGGKILALGIGKQTQPLCNPNQHPRSRKCP